MRTHRQRINRPAVRVSKRAAGNRYIADVAQATDYDAYGSWRFGRSTMMTESYRYMWHGMRRPDGLSDPHMYITPFRLYDVRLGRWNTRDPIFDPSVSPYEGMGSNPISLTDLWGLNPGGGQGSGESTDRMPAKKQPDPAPTEATDQSSNRAFRPFSENRYHGSPIPAYSQLGAALRALQVSALPGNSFERFGLIFTPFVDKDHNGVFYAVKRVSDQNPETLFILIVSPEDARRFHSDDDEAEHFSTAFHWAAFGRRDWVPGAFMADGAGEVARRTGTEWRNAVTDPNFYLMLAGSVAASSVRSAGRKVSESANPAPEVTTKARAAKGVGELKFPGTNPATAPEGFEWRGQPGSTPGSKGGNWYNPKTGETLRPDLNHPAPIGPHWDYKDRSGNWWRMFPDGTSVPK